MQDILPSLDVVVLCYNEEDEVAGCLDALLAQRNELSRIIVVDNNSTDATGSIIAAYELQYPDSITSAFEPTQGTAYARNKGFEISTATIMARIDADTRVMPGWAKALREFYAAHPGVAAGTGAVEFYDLPGRRLARFMTWLFVRVVNKVSGGSVDMYGANMSLRRQVWLEIKDDVKMDADIMEDLSIGISLGSKGYRTASIPAAFAEVSGRRLRTSPRQFARYNLKWPRTYAVYGQRFTAFMIGIAAWLGIILQVVAAFFLQYHDPKTGRFGLRKVSNYAERVIP